MSLNSMRIPKTVKVGYQNRKDTYSGKLAYVTYIDEKGKHRSEHSWNRWRDKKIEPNDFTNEPRTGFVLNKKVGDYHSGWDSRMAKIRVYDPNGFELEISVENLLFILQETSSIQGKGLEGEFVYAWDGKDVVLLPTCSQEYKNSSKFTKLQTNKISRTDMIEGCLYRNKQNNIVMYLGRHDYNTYNSWRDDPYTTKKCHIFQYINESGDVKNNRMYSDGNDSAYWTQTGYTNLAERLSETPNAEFANKYEAFIQSACHSGPIIIKELPVMIKDDQCSYTGIFKHESGILYSLYIKKEQYGVYKDKYSIHVQNKGVLVNNKVIYDNRYGYHQNAVKNAYLLSLKHLGKYVSNNNHYYKHSIYVTVDEIKKMNLVEICMVNAYNNKCYELGEH